MEYVIIFIVVIVVIIAIINNSKDSEELVEKSLEEKFNVIINHICDYAFDGDYNVKHLSKKHIMFFHSEISNQMIEILYNQGVLTIIWKYKYFQKELKFKKHLNNVRNLSLFEQDKIGASIVGLMSLKINEFQQKILKNS